MEGTENKVLFFFIGAALGLGGAYIWQKKTMEKKMRAEAEKGKESGYMEAHENFKKVLNYVHLRNGSPADVFNIITSQN